MFSWFKKNATIQKISDEEWSKLFLDFEFLQKLDDDSVIKLRQLMNEYCSKRFIIKAQKQFDRNELLLVVCQASVLVLNLGTEWLEILDNIAQADSSEKLKLNGFDNFGSSYLPVLSGMIDSIDGDKNGIPPLHSSIDKKNWQTVITDAYEDFKNRVTIGPKNEILFDESATKSRAHFFSIMTECFFIEPDTVRCAYPDVYQQLCLFYRQNPAVQQNMNTNNVYKSMFNK